MKRKSLWLVFALGVGVAFGWWFVRRQRAAAPKPVVTIQDGKTIDFSSGTPVVKDSPADKAILDSAVAEMDAAAKNVTFAPTAPARKNPGPPPSKK